MHVTRNAGLHGANTGLLGVFASEGQFDIAWDTGRQVALSHVRFDGQPDKSFVFFHPMGSSEPIIVFADPALHGAPCEVVNGTHREVNDYLATLAL